jgi:hypothetical protein
MSKTVDFKKIVRQAAAYGATLRELPLQIETPDEMDPLEAGQLTAAANSIFTHMKALEGAGIDAGAIAAGSSMALGCFVREACPAHVLEPFAKNMAQGLLKQCLQPKGPTQ